ncbi:MAG: hypothetical protein Q7S53_00465 [bacterium]|nr:hypothetical protein [bacterium]
MCGPTVYEFNDGLHAIADTILKGRSKRIARNINLVVAVAGGSCSGKSYFCEKLVGALTALNISQTKLMLDDYFRDISDPQLPVGSGGLPLFDSPGSYQEAEIKEHLLALVSNKTVECPVYDLTRNKRSHKETVSKNPSEVIIVDGLFAIDIVRSTGVPSRYVFLDASGLLRLKRRINRDAEMFNISPDIITDVFWDQIEPAHQEFIEPQRKFADLIIKT